jgi:predicted flap endonuclease-1-like 5' DNA nuclease
MQFRFYSTVPSVNKSDVASLFSAETLYDAAAAGRVATSPLHAPGSISGLTHLRSDELTEIKGVGPRKAQRLHRALHGPFVARASSSSSSSSSYSSS